MARHGKFDERMRHKGFGLGRLIRSAKVAREKNEAGQHLASRNGRNLRWIKHA